MMAAELFATLTEAGCRLQIAGDTLRLHDPQHMMTDALRQAIKDCKAELVTLLAYRAFRDFLELWEERSALMEYDGGLHRDQAEWQAYVCVKGENHVPQ
jgi:hypothetical protein